MNDVTAPRALTFTEFSHVKPGDTGWRTGGLRDFLLYRDLGVAAATHGQVLAQLVRANIAAPSTGTGWHRHDAKFHIVIIGAINNVERTFVECSLRLDANQRLRNSRYRAGRATQKRTLTALKFTQVPIGSELAASRGQVHGVGAGAAHGPVTSMVW